uniref:RRM domain-containing protein n=1 Tax=Echeneis naucrates TaxID=173247 RepID=A0A665UKT6_ECHNA
MEEVKEEGKDGAMEEAKEEGKDGEMEEPPCSRVVYLSNLPQRFYTDAQFVKLVRGFGKVVRYFLVRPVFVIQAFVEMKNAPDAQKMVDYYSSNILRINSDALKVSFSGEYKSLILKSPFDSSCRHVASAQKYEEGETASTKKEGNQIEEKEMGKDTKRKRNESQEKEMKRRSSSKDRTEQRSSTERRTRSRSRGRSRRDRSMSSRSRDRSSTERRTRSRSRERSSRDRRTKTRSKSREKLKDYGSREEPEKLGNIAVPMVRSLLPCLVCLASTGTEFVRPVVGYFCHLCQVIYADEDEAKVQHCRSPAHYRKYQVTSCSSARHQKWL